MSGRPRSTSGAMRRWRGLAALMLGVLSLVAACLPRAKKTTVELADTKKSLSSVNAARFSTHPTLMAEAAVAPGATWSKVE